MARYPESRTRGLIKMDVLREGEENRAHRIRAAAEIHDWLAALSAAERGELLTEVYVTQQEAQTIPTENQNMSFQILEREVPSRLRWKSERRAQVEALLVQGDTLTPMASGTVYRTETGGYLPRRTVKALERAGVLEPLTPRQE